MSAPTNFITERNYKIGNLFLKIQYLWQYFGIPFIQISNFQTCYAVRVLDVRLRDRHDPINDI